MGCIFIVSGLIAFLVSLGLGRLSFSERQIHLLADRRSPRRLYVAKVWALALVLLAAAGAVGARMDRVDGYSQAMLCCVLVGAAARPDPPRASGRLNASLSGKEGLDWWHGAW
jgi:hypothetical protein